MSRWSSKNPSQGNNEGQFPSLPPTFRIKDSMTLYQQSQNGKPTVSKDFGTIRLRKGANWNLRMSSKRPITLGVNVDDRIIQIRTTFNDPTTVLVTALAPGKSEIKLTDLDSRQESFLGIVEE